MSRSQTWKLRDRTLMIDVRGPLMMGIVNVTPDSFSDGGDYQEPGPAIDKGLELVEQGADILDIGGESTRPYSTPVDAQAECDRVLPVIAGIRQQVSVPISIDTSKAIVARRAIEMGADIINDVTGLEGDPEMVAVARREQVGICAMHMQKDPQSMQDAPHYDDVVADVVCYLRRRYHELAEAGIDPQSICLDPGIGFGKTDQHNLQLLQEVRRFLDMGCPVLVGHSRKGFLRTFSGDDSKQRIGATLAVSLYLAQAGIQILRVHDVKNTQTAIEMHNALHGS